MDTRTRVVVSPCSTLPPELATLVEESVAGGFRFLERLREDWDSGANQFSSPDEIFVSARMSGTLVGVGGLNRDPFADPERVGRLRRFYVREEDRRTGVGSVMLDAILDFAKLRYSSVRLRTDSQAASKFYVSAGFHPIIGNPDATHGMVLPVTPAV